MKKLNIAIIGQGRSGRDIHGAYLKSENNTKFNIREICFFIPLKYRKMLGIQTLVITKEKRK